MVFKSFATIATNRKGSTGIAHMKKNDTVKTYVSLADMHFPKIHKPTLAAVKDFLKQNKVDGLIYQGDQLDMENISHHTKGKPWFRQRQGYMSDINGFRKVVLDPIED